MVNRKNLADIIFGAYAVVGIATFGFAADDAERLSAAKTSACWRTNAEALRVGESPGRYCIADSSVGAMSGVAAGTFWPAYWTWTAVSHLRGPIEG